MSPGGDGNGSNGHGAQRLLVPVVSVLLAALCSGGGYLYVNLNARLDRVEQIAQGVHAVQVGRGERIGALEGRVAVNTSALQTLQAELRRLESYVYPAPSGRERR